MRRYYHYLVDGALLRVVATAKPAMRSTPYVVRQFQTEIAPGSWEVPSFPEIPASKLLRGEFLGSVPRPERPR